MLVAKSGKCYRYVDKIGSTGNWWIRTLSAQAQTKPKVERNADVEWENAKPYSSIPGPSKLALLKSFLPGGKLHNLNLHEMNKVIYADYGVISKFPGMFGKPDIVFTYDAKDIQTIFRNEGQWPVRRGIDTFEYYRRHVRPDVFKNVGGLVNDQGEAWGKLRTAVNPIMMKPKTVKAYIPDIDKVAIDFVRKVKTLRNEKNEMPDDFQNELNKWSLESIALIALEQRLGIIDRADDPENQKLINAVKDFFSLAYELDVKPSIWKYYKTPKFNRLMAAFDVMTDLAKSHIDKAIERIETQNNNEHGESVLEKILKVNKQYAIVMALDMLLAGIDTTAAASACLLYNLGCHQAAQDKLREEIINLLPDPNTPLTQESLNNLPYLRACIKESMRVTPIISGNVRNIARDIVIQGYQIPAGTDFMMSGVTLSRSDDFVDRALEFIPERFLKEAQPGCPNAKDINPFLMLPFGFGARACIGKRFAEMEMEVLIIRLLRECKIEWNYGPMEFSSALVLTPKSKLKYKITDL